MGRILVPLGRTSYPVSIHSEKTIFYLLFMMKAKGLSLHIGMNAVDPGHYDGWSGELDSCEHDAVAMEHIASECGYQTRLLLTSKATKQTALDTITQYAAQLTAGDIFLLTFSGHGGRVFGIKNEQPEFEFVDETLCFYDEMLVDDELKCLFWPLFQKDVRIQCVFDSCHSGGMLKYQGGYAREDPLPWNTPKNVPDGVIWETLKKNQTLYTKIRQKTSQKKKAKQEIQAIVAILAACKEHEVAYANHDHSLFTEFLLRTWEGGAFTDLDDFCGKIFRAIPNRRQTPNLQMIGNAPEDLLRKRKPFEI